jgi:hypothetical protein
MKMTILASVMMLLSIANVHASDKGGLFVEPMLTYELGKGDVSFPKPFSSSDSKLRGWGVGTRLGVHVWDTVFIGADGRYSIPKFKDSSLGQDVKTKSWNVGPVVGLQMPTIVGLRAWGSWILAGQVDPEKDKGVDEKFGSANGWRVGAGFNILMLSLNVEYQDVKYDKTTVDQVGIFTTGFSSSDIVLNNKSWILSVSFPIAL